jgi:hypothetical protein
MDLPHGRDSGAKVGDNWRRDRSRPSVCACCDLAQAQRSLLAETRTWVSPLDLFQKRVSIFVVWTQSTEGNTPADADAPSIVCLSSPNSDSWQSGGLSCSG